MVKFLDMKNYNMNADISLISNGDFGTNTYIIQSLISNKAVIIDPADGEKICSIIKSKELKPIYIINTHGHYDHISGNKHIKEKYDIPICIHPLDKDFLTDPGLNMSGFMAEEYTSPMADVLLVEGKTIKFDNVKLMIHETPGHTQGSISLSMNDMIFTGDLIFKQGIGRTDLPGGNIDAIINTLKTFYLKLKFENLIFPGHGEIGNKLEFDKIVQQFFYTY